MPSKAKPKPQAKKTQAKKSTASVKRNAPASIKTGAPRGDFDASRQRRRLAKWTPTSASLNTILTSAGELLRARARDTLRNNALAAIRIAAQAGASEILLYGMDPAEYEALHDFRGFAEGLLALIGELQARGIKCWHVKPAAEPARKKAKK